MADEIGPFDTFPVEKLRAFASKAVTDANTAICLYNREREFTAEAHAALSGQLVDLLTQRAESMALDELLGIQAIANAGYKALRFKDADTVTLTVSTLAASAADQEDAKRKREAAASMASAAAAEAATASATHMQEMAEATTRPHAVKLRSGVRLLLEAVSDHRFPKLRKQLHEDVLRGDFTDAMLFKIIDFGLQQPDVLLKDSKLMVLLVHIVTTHYNMDMRVANTLTVVNETDQIQWYGFELKGKHGLPMISSAERDPTIARLRAVLEPLIRAETTGDTYAEPTSMIAGGGAGRVPPFGYSRARIEPPRARRTEEVMGAGQVVQLGAPKDTTSLEYWVDMYNPGGDVAFKADFRVLAKFLVNLKAQNDSMIKGLRIMWDTLHRRLNNNHRSAAPRGGAESAEDLVYAVLGGAAEGPFFQTDQTQGLRKDYDRVKTEADKLKSENDRLKAEVERLKATNARLVEKGKKLDPNF